MLKRGGRINAQTLSPLPKMTMSRTFEPLAWTKVRPPDRTDTDPPLGLLPPTGASRAETRLRVLALDDEEDAVDCLAENLRHFNVRVDTATTPAKFFASLEDIKPDAVILDLMMPANDGIAIMRRLRDMAFAGDIVILSGADSHVIEASSRVASSYGLKVAGFLQKPFRSETLLGILGLVHADGEISDGARVRAALDADEIRPYFQPKLDLRTGEIVGAEALSRWQHPEQGILAPGAYLKSVQFGGHQGLHDLSILERTLAFCKEVNQRNRRLRFAVNFAAEAILGDAFLEAVKDALQRYEVQPDQLIVELTEADAFTNFETLAESLLRLRLFGVRISIDDFGVGHSSLSRIQRLPVNEIKIDGSFVKGMTEYADDVAIVRSIIDLAHSLHCTAVAEGVETKAALAALKTLDCDCAQGFLFSPAVTEEAFLSLLENADQRARTAGR